MIQDARTAASASAQEPTASGTAETQERRRLRLYLLPIVALPLLMLVSAFFILPTYWFAVRSGNAYLANLGYGAELSHRDCQVLIYGDSSAMVGIDPAVIRQHTGLTACNVAEFEGITLVNHTQLIDGFIERNPRPRFIVFLYTPEDLSVPNDWTSFNVGTFEAVSFQLEHERNLRTAWLLASHPGVTFGWAEQGMRLLAERFHSKPISPEAASIREEHDGQLPITDVRLAQCDGILRNRLPDVAWVNSLRQRYGTDGTRVLVDATPTTVCDLSLGFYQQHLNGLVDNTPYLPLPLAVYSMDGRLHANREGSLVLSTMVADQINGQLNPAAKDMGAR